MSNRQMRPRLPTEVPSFTHAVRCWRFHKVIELSAAEEILDWAEFQGFQELELIVLGPAEFVVMWR
jgi:hypothetical protein